MIKYHVHIIKVTRSNEKIQFQIKLPRNAKRIVAIKVTAKPLIRLVHKIAPNYPVEAGWLWFRIPEKRDVFYAETVRRPLPLHSQTFLNHRPIGDFDQGSFWTQGKKEEFLSVNAELNSNVLEGFYIDRIHTEQFDHHRLEENKNTDEKEKHPKNEKEMPHRTNTNKRHHSDRIGYEVRIYLKIET